MRSTEERVTFVKRRIKEIERQKKLRRGRMIGAAVVAACFTIIFGLSFALPSLTADLPGREYHYFGTAGSILDGRGGFGFAIIGLISFVLGACATMLCHRIHLKNKKNRDNKGDDDG